MCIARWPEELNTRPIGRGAQDGIGHPPFDNDSIYKGRDVYDAAASFEKGGRLQIGRKNLERLAQLPNVLGRIFIPVQPTPAGRGLSPAQIAESMSLMSEKSVELVAPALKKRAARFRAGSFELGGPR
jgi:hypothetical protein